MSIPVIYRGDDTCANGRTVAIQLPDEDLAGFSLRFDFLGWTFIFDDLKRKGVVRADFSESATCRMPLGTHMGTLRLGKNGMWHTISGTVPVKVSDDVGETYGGDVASVNLAMDVCGGIPDLTGVNTSPKNANALATAFKALVDALKKGSTTLAAIAVAFCACASEPLTVTTAPLGDVDFDNRVVVGVSLNTADFATKTDVTNAVADKVDTGTLQSMSWTNDNFSSSVIGTVYTDSLFTNGVKAIVGSQLERPTVDEWVCCYDGVRLKKVGEDSSFGGMKKWNVSGVDGSRNETTLFWAFGQWTLYRGSLSNSPIIINGNECDSILSFRVVNNSLREYWVLMRCLTNEIVYSQSNYPTTNNVWVTLSDVKRWSGKQDRLSTSNGVYQISVNAAQKDSAGNVIAEYYLPRSEASSGSMDDFYDWKTNEARVVLGNSSQVTSAKGIAIGVPNASGDRTGAAGNSSVAIGIHATTDATASQGIAIGANATASASKAVQIGEGSNANEGTLQFRSWQLVDNAGKIPSERIGGGVVTQGDVTNVVSAVRDLIYDEKTHVTWKRTMYDGNLYYIAVTNVNIVSED